ncbi:MAG: alanine:cation symporter family protein, partial [Bacteroidales bacterium]|nr:alanine:cation symporter family protein [Bacteroidales bacterium]
MNNAFTIEVKASSCASFFGSDMNEAINHFFQPIVAFLDRILFWDPFVLMGFNFPVKIPFIIIWLIAGALFFTFYLRFINLRGFKHAIDLVLGRFDKDSHSGEISHFQALATATASTVGLGNIAGVAVAITMGGPGATFWLIVAGFLGMTTKLVECTLGVKYRKIDAEGNVSGGPMYYLRDGLARKGWRKTGKLLAMTFALFATIGAFGIGNMFQSNQMIAQTVSTFPALQGKELWLGLIVALLTGIVIIGGIKGIARVNDKLFPLMAGIYLVSALIVIGVNYRHIDDAFWAILRGA